MLGLAKFSELLLCDHRLISYEIIKSSLSWNYLQLHLAEHMHEVSYLGDPIGLRVWAQLVPWQHARMAPG